MRLRSKVLKPSPVEPVLTALPVGEHSVKKLVECRAVVRFGDAAEFVGDDTVYGVDGRFNKTTIWEVADIVALVEAAEVATAPRVRGLYRKKAAEISN